MGEGTFTATFSGIWREAVVELEVIIGGSPGEPTPVAALTGRC